jgi:hypothetical protein
MAAYDHALLYCQYITMWLLWDDDVIEKISSVSHSVLLPLYALSGENIDTGDQYIAAFKYLGDSYEKLGASRAWRKRFANKMIEWAEFAIQEEIARRQDINITKRSFDDALNLRSMTVGIRPNSVTLERAVGIEVPEYIHIDPDYELFLDQAAKICCIVNDLVGVPKDIKNNQVQSNLILYYQLYYHCSLKDAYNALIEIHDQSVRNYDQLAKKLLSKVELAFSERLAVFFQQLRYMDSGFGYWHQDCVRYQSLTASDGVHYFKLKINDYAKDNNLLSAA